MGAIGAILAGAADPRVKAVVATSGPADPYRLTRQTFRLAHLPIPNVIAYPLAWLTTRVYVRPRGHRVADISAARAIARYAGPVLLAHGEFDTVVPPSHMERLAAAARAGRADDPTAERVETLLVKGGQHSWLYEDPGYRAVMAGFLARVFGGPLDPTDAAQRAEAINAKRIPDIETVFEAVKGTPGGLRTLASLALPGATRAPRADAEGDPMPSTPGALPSAPIGEP
jgi:dienelactone hydrolase